MPSCHFAIRTLIRNCSATASSRPVPWQLLRRRYSTSVEDIRSDDTRTRPRAPNFSDGDSESAYLDLILGPAGRPPGHSDTPSSTTSHVLSALETENGGHGRGDEGTKASQSLARGGRRRLGHAWSPSDTAAPLPKRPSHVSKRRQPQTSTSAGTPRSGKTAGPSPGTPMQQKSSQKIPGLTQTAGLKSARERGPFISRRLVLRPETINPRSSRERKPQIWYKHVLSRTPFLPLSSFERRDTLVFVKSARKATRNAVDFRAQVTKLLQSHQSDPHTRPDPPRLPPSVFDKVERIYDCLRNQTGDKSVGRLARTFNSNSWHHITLWFLYYEPGMALDFLIATDSGHRPRNRARVLRSSLQYLITRALSIHHDQNVQELMVEFADAAVVLSRRWVENPLLIGRLYGYLLVPIIRHCDVGKVQDLYGSLKPHHSKVSWATWLHFASVLATHDQYHQALDAILEAKNAGASLDTQAFRSCCATLLRRSVRQPGELRTTIRIIDNLVKIGLPLNNQLANIVMLNAIESGDLKTAFSIYHSLRDHGLQADEYTYAILLKGCKIAIDDATILNETIRDALAHVDILQTPVVATEILHCLALHHTKHHSENAFETVADAYAQLFDLEPLRHLGLLIPKLSRIDNPQIKRPLPTSHDMHILVATYVEQSYAKGNGVRPAYELYQRFKNLVETGQRPFPSMAQTDHIYNAFLSTFIKSKNGLLYAAGLVKDMQRPPPPDAEYEHSRPTVWTWSIFLHGFTRHNQMQLAEQVMIYMRSKGIKPSNVTYNTLVSGYSAAQNVQGVLDTLKRMETDGNTWDDWTMHAVKRIKNQTGLQEALVAQNRADSMDFTQDLRSGLVERVSLVKFDEVQHQRRREEADKTDEEYFGGEQDDRGS